MNRDFVPPATDGELFQASRYLDELLEPMRPHIASVYTRSSLGGGQVIVRFDNAYGVSIALMPGAAAAFQEISIIKFYGFNLYDYQVVQQAIPLRNLKKGQIKEDILDFCNRVSML